MKHVYRNDGVVCKTVHRDAHDHSRIYLETRTNDAATLRKNAQLRASEALRVGDANPLVDGDELTAAFSFASMTDYDIARRKYPDLFAELDLGGAHSVHAGEKLSLLLPEHCTMVKRGDSKR